jgi:proteic killer suppression protein
MIVSFHDAGTEDLFNGRDTRLARRACPQVLWRIAVRKLEALDSAGALQDLRSPPGNELEKLNGDRQGAYSIRINRQYRVCFVWTARGPESVEVCDYH